LFALRYGSWRLPLKLSEPLLAREQLTAENLPLRVFATISLLPPVRVKFTSMPLCQHPLENGQNLLFELCQKQTEPLALIAGSKLAQRRGKSILGFPGGIQGILDRAKPQRNNQLASANQMEPICGSSSPSPTPTGLITWRSFAPTKGLLEMSNALLVGQSESNTYGRNYGRFYVVPESQ
jgi:hypothetical protein